jgi:hypothetical protein
MAIYQGTRLGSVGFPGAPEAEASSRAVRPPVAATPRIRPAVLLVAIILVGTIVGLAYLTQTLGANASNVELGRLASQRDQSQRQLLTQRSMIAARTTDGEIEERATLSGLVDLGDAFIVRVR